MFLTSYYTHHDLEVVAGDDRLSVLHPAHSGLRVTRHRALHLDVRALVCVRVGRVVQELGRHCRKTQWHFRNFGEAAAVASLEMTEICGCNTVQLQKKNMEVSKSRKPGGLRTARGLASIVSCMDMYTARSRSCHLLALPKHWRIYLHTQSWEFSDGSWRRPTDLPWQ